MDMRRVLVVAMLSAVLAADLPMQSALASAFVQGHHTHHSQCSNGICQWRWVLWARNRTFSWAKLKCSWRAKDSLHGTRNWRRTWWIRKKGYKSVSGSGSASSDFHIADLGCHYLNGHL